MHSTKKNNTEKYFNPDIHTPRDKQRKILVYTYTYETKYLILMCFVKNKKNMESNQSPSSPLARIMKNNPSLPPNFEWAKYTS